MIGATLEAKHILISGKSADGIRTHLTEMSIARINKIRNSRQAGAASFSCRKNTTELLRVSLIHLRQAGISALVATV
jgi:hypothetical protein